MILNSKNKALELLEISIGTLSQSLGISLEDVFNSFEIPVEQSHQDYKVYESLMFMVDNFNKLKAQDA